MNNRNNQATSLILLAYSEHGISDMGYIFKIFGEIALVIIEMCMLRLVENCVR